MTAYIIVDTNVSEPELYEEYKALARPVAEQYGGEYLARGGEMRIDDDDLWTPRRLVVLSFPDMAAANAFLDSDEYAPVKQLRRQYATSTVVVVDGAPTAPSTPAERRIEVQRAIAADPATIFDLLRRPEGHVEIDASGMLMSATGEPAGSVGDRFTVHMDRDSLRDFDLGEYDVEVVMTVFEPDREIAWTIDGQLQPPINHVYGYRLEAIDGGTIVTSYYDWSEIHEQYEPFAETIFPVVSEQNLRGTLGILARRVAPGASRPQIDTA
ncbi:MAG: DUF1330 domain-containing protein [Ilumatobacteraceae bacterium]|nr:DUF1330 domain-containing protein [Ilumatobacteraceae bacterium]